MRDIVCDSKGCVLEPIYTSSEKTQNNLPSTVEYENTMKRSSKKKIGSKNVSRVKSSTRPSLKGSGSKRKPASRKGAAKRKVTKQTTAKKVTKRGAGVTSSSKQLLILQSILKQLNQKPKRRTK